MFDLNFIEQHLKEDPDFMEEYQQHCYEKLLESVKNRRQIQGLRLELFRQIDEQPKQTEKDSLQQKLYFDTIMDYALQIKSLLKKNQDIYINYFMENRQGILSNVRYLLLPDESQFFRWEMFYLQFLNRFLNDKRMYNQESVRYYQMLYDLMIKDMSYGNAYDFIRVISDDSDSDSDWDSDSNNNK